MTQPKCPKCKDAVLARNKVRTPSGAYVVQPYACPSCAGMWLAAGEAEVAAELVEDAAPAARSPNDARSGRCPFGHGLLERARIDVDEPFYLDRCPTCRGVFFDAGEWDRLARARLLHDVDALFDPLFQKRRAAARAEAAHRGRLVAALGSDVVEGIEAVADRLRDHPGRHDAVAYLLDRLGMQPSHGGDGS